MEKWELPVGITEINSKIAWLKKEERLEDLGKRRQ